ncbi:MAG: carboxypeptidase M32 [Clostridium sp.]|nr:carboxypeptidase M32 [Clostridium sp.]
MNVTGEDLKFFAEYKEICAAYRIAGSTMYFDLATAAPKAGIPYRNRMLAVLSGEAFSYQMAPEYLGRLEDMYRRAEEGSELKRELALYFRLIEDVRKLPKEVYVRKQQVLADSQSAWQQAKEKNDFGMFLPHLEKVIAVQKEALTYLDKKCGDYDYLLDRYEMGTSAAAYDSFFTAVKEKLLPLIGEIQRRGKKIDDSILFSDYDVRAQEAFVEELKDYLQVDRNCCYMGLSEHPFTEFFSARETRITTHYYKNNLLSAILSTVHEYGHALYALQVEEKYDGTAFKDAIGSAMHESQSRLMENHIGRHPAFWEVNYPKLQKHFPDKLGNISLEQFVEVINVSRPSLIRTEADELTYPVHVLIRYELEKEIFDGNVDISGLDRLWNDKYRKYLGVSPSGPAEGILQDIHWSAGDFGYFPTYAIGSAYGAQFFRAMEKEISVEDALRQGKMQVITDWMKEKIHRYGAAKTADEILVSATGEHFNPAYYIDYLVKKYTKLYEL